ncbi:glycosyltransferase family 4 protein [Acetobacter orleanensis]|nr:glycosyltransferase family 4 protein [Acetobacter orleanensis]KXV63189.1 lipopolysaccharide biosynthesis protein [Acetobacter orleanensis]PCD80699.1 glycosyltransferase family 4 protein [Acetobacter orleanensis]
MRIGFVIHTIGLMGGTERTCCAVMNGLAAYADLTLVEVVSEGPPAYFLDERIEREILSAQHVSLLWSAPRLIGGLYRLIKARRLEALVVVESTHALYAVAAARLAGVRCIVWEHFNYNVDLGKRKRRWGRAVAAKWADDIVTLTHRDQSIWQQKARPSARVHCIPNMAPPVSQEPYETAARTVLALGRLSAQKGFDRLLQAWRLVEKDPRSAGWHLTIVGDGPQKAMLAEQAASLERVSIQPAQKDVAALFGQAGLMASSSRFEGLPMVLLEAAAFGVPIVAFDCETGPAEIIVPGETGVLVPQDDIVGLAEGVLSLMADPEKRQAFSTNGKDRMAFFSRDHVVSLWRALLGV